MKRCAFLQLLMCLPVLRWLPASPVQARPYTGGQWVFDGVHGLTFPATSGPPNATRLLNLRALTFFERLFGGTQ